MIQYIWRQALAALALVSLSACAAEVPTTDGTPADDSEPDRPSSAVAASEDERRDVASPAPTPTMAGTLSPAQLLRAAPEDPNGPYPEPWSRRKGCDHDGNR